MKNTAYRNSVVVSFVLHLLLLAIWASAIDLKFLAREAPPAKPPEPPLVFDLQEQKRPREVIETPEDAKVDELQRDAELASDKNALARNHENHSQLPIGDPFSRGEVEFRELPQNPVPPGEPGAPAREQKEREQENRHSETEPFASQQFEKFTREYLTQPKTTANPGAQASPPRPRYDNSDTQALEKGAISFNTYEWNFAPYMLALKKRVEGNIFPPPAFTYMGIISGETLLRFKIYPNGELRDLTLLTYEGHETLMQTSLRAIEISAPFPPLPADFPEAYLEVTAKFHYSVLNRH